MDLAEFNRTFTARVNRLVIAIRRGEASPRVPAKRVRRGAGFVIKTRQTVPLEYLRAVKPRTGSGMPMAWAGWPCTRVSQCFGDDGKLLQVNHKALKALVVHHGFGHRVTLQRVGRYEGQHDVGFMRSAWYVSKYVVDAADRREAVPWCDSEGVRCRRASYRAWTASRRWGVTMGCVRDQLTEMARESALEAEAAEPPQPTAPLVVFSDSYWSISHRNG